MPDFYPRRDSDLRDWATNFAAQLSASPGDYGVSAEQVAGFVALEQAYAQWYARSQSASTRTVACVQMKNGARKAMMDKGRALAAVVRARPETTDAQLVRLGLRPRRKRRRAVGVPSEAPRVWVKSVTGARATVRLRDRVTVTPSGSMVQLL